MIVRRAIVLAAAFSVPLGSPVMASERYDLKIINGMVFDGTGRPAEPLTIGIRKDRIAYVDSSPDIDADRTIDARGLFVAPGFIDAHNHLEEFVAKDAQKFNEQYIRQGVTTIVGGADGGRGLQEIRSFISAYNRQGVGTNVSFYIGHNGVRREVMGKDQRREPTHAELRAMQDRIRQGLELGAVGVSSGLMYEPGRFSTTSEVMALARAAAPFRVVYDTHDRDPQHDILDSIDEALRIGAAGNLAVKLAHLKAVGRHNKGLIDRIIAIVEAERAQGRDVTSDQYPYDGAASVKLDYLIITPAAYRGGNLRRLLADRHARQAFKTASENGENGSFSWIKTTGYDFFRVNVCPGCEELEGQFVSEIAERQGKSGFDVLADLLVSNGDSVQLSLVALFEEDVEALLVRKWNMIASDGDAITPEARNQHPRSTGTFPKIFRRYVRERGILSWEEAVRKMTSLPARVLGLQRRGQIAKGYFADIAIFDPQRISDRATWSNPGRFSEGVVHVLVNGRPALANEVMTGDAPGRFASRDER